MGILLNFTKHHESVGRAAWWKGLRCQRVVTNKFTHPCGKLLAELVGEHHPQGTQLVKIADAVGGVDDTADSLNPEAQSAEPGMVSLPRD